MCAEKNELSKNDSGYPTAQSIESESAKADGTFPIDDAQINIVTVQQRQETYNGPMLISYQGEQLPHPIEEESVNHPPPTADTQPPNPQQVFFQIGGSLQKKPLSARPTSASATAAIAKAQQVVSDVIREKDKRIEELESQVSIKEKELTEVKQEKEIVEGKLQVVTVKLKAAETKLEAKDLEVAELKSSVGDKNKALRDKDRKIGEYKDRLSDAEKRGAREREVLEAKISDLRSELNSNKEQHKEEVLQLTKEKHELELQLVKMEVKQKGLECDIQTAQKEKAVIEADLAKERQRSAEGELERVQEGVQGLLKEKVKSEAKLKEKDNVIADLNRQISALSSQISSDPSLTSQQSYEQPSQDEDDQ